MYFIRSILLPYLYMHIGGIAIHKGRYCSTTGINLLGDHCKGILDQKEFLCQLKTIETMSNKYKCMYTEGIYILMTIYFHGPIQKYN